MALAYYMFPKEVNSVIKGLELNQDPSPAELKKKELFDETAQYEHLDDPLLVREASEKIRRADEPVMVYTQSYQTRTLPPPREEPSKQETQTAPMLSADDTKTVVKTAVGISSILLLIIIFWLLFSVASVIYSLVCFGKSGTMVEKLVGVALAVFLGPFYFVYLVANKGYCA